jgi:hypothetical protein
MVVINRVPLDRELKWIEPRFPPLDGLLYLELLENPKKVRKDRAAMLPRKVVDKKDIPKTVYIDYPPLKKEYTIEEVEEEHEKKHDRDDDEKEHEKKRNRDDDERERKKKRDRDDERDREKKREKEEDRLKDILEDDRDGPSPPITLPIHNPVVNVPVQEQPAIEVIEEVYLTPEEQEQEEREEYNWRFKILKKKFRDTMQIQMPNEFEDIKTIKKRYNSLLKDVRIDAYVESKMKYLFVTWIVIEYVGVRLIGPSMKKFTKTQIMCRNRYEDILYELGENSTHEEQWSPMVRLVILVATQTIVFFVVGMASKHLGEDVASLFRSFLNQPDTEASKPIEKNQDTVQVPVKKMKGPSSKIKKVDSTV